MRYIDSFRDPEAARALRSRVERAAAKLGQRHVRIMEVCGTHTMALGRYGIRAILPKNIEMISGPGCPVCVTDSGYIDAAIGLAERGVIVGSFGDMLKVPGTDASLSQARSKGARIEVCYSPTDAVNIAAKHPEKEVVFLGIGFETTVCPVLGALEAARRRDIENFSLLTAFKLVPPAMELLASDPEIAIDAFLCPAHVSAIIGANAYEPVASSFSMPCVVAGFEPLDILYGIEGILEQILNSRAEVENQYSRVVKPEGNLKAKAMIDKFLEPIDAAWRGIGVIPKSGLGLSTEFSMFDARQRHGIEVVPSQRTSGCRCGEVLKGIIKPEKCALFGSECTPQHPIGPCMVSSEGTCSAYYKYGGEAAL